MTTGGFFAGLNTGMEARAAPFLNFGWLDPDARPDRRAGATATSLALVERLIGDVELRGCRLVDIGCGRGGALRVLGDRHGAAPTIGLDLDADALVATRSRRRTAVAPVVRADALDLPLRPGGVDVILNVESACLYGDLPRFHRETAAALRTGGHFLHADIMPTEVVTAPESVFAPTGLDIEQVEDITVNVQASVRARARGTNPDVSAFLQWFGGELDRDDLAYVIVRARRSDDADPSVSSMRQDGLGRLDEFIAEALRRAGSL